MAEYGGKIRFVVRDFPLVTIHEDAFRAALAANAANAQGKFFEYTEILYRNQNALDDRIVKKIRRRIGFKSRAICVRLAKRKIRRTKCAKTWRTARNYGITGTPTIFVNGVKVRAMSAKVFATRSKKR